QWDHRGLPPVSASTAALNAVGSIVPVVRIRAPLANSISMVPAAADPACQRRQGMRPGLRISQDETTKKERIGVSLIRSRVH
ncbi:MAG TPA: hypothetical protein VIJ67_04365, partial [Pseudolabrys sp.]